MQCQVSKCVAGDTNPVPVSHWASRITTHKRAWDRLCIPLGREVPDAEESWFGQRNVIVEYPSHWGLTPPRRAWPPVDASHWRIPRPGGGASARRILNSADQSASAMHRPSTSGCPARSDAFAAAISSRHRSTSRRHCASLCGNRAVASPVGLNLRLLPGEFLPTPNHHVAILWLQFDQPCLPPRLLASD